MEAIVLAGGMGTRLKAVVPDLPKPMAPVAGRPFLEIVLSALADKGFSRVILSVGYKAEVIVSHFGQRFSGMAISYEIEESPLGTGGAMRAAMSRCDGDHVFVFNGDTFLDVEATDIERNWSWRRTPLIIAKQVKDAERYGTLKVEGRRVLGFYEKGVHGPGLINAGCYILPTDVLDRYDIGQAFSFETDYLPEAVQRNHFEYYMTNGLFVDIGVPEDYLLAQSIFGDQ